MCKKRRKIAVFTGNRADYGLQYPIIKAINEDEGLDYVLLVSGAHTHSNYGSTIKEIERDGFDIHEIIEFGNTDSSLMDTATSIGEGIVKISEVLHRVKPDILVVYADRSESFAALIAGTQMGIPTAHIEGGDYTEGGALDDSVRHAMTKLAHIHFTTNEDAARRVEAMGEEPWRIHNVGFPTLDLIEAGSYTSADEIYDLYNLNPDKKILLCTQHAVATECDMALEQIQATLIAIDGIVDKYGVQVIITYPNNDAGGATIIKEIERYAKNRPSDVQVHKSLGRVNYHGALNIASVCIGNSSSGIKETPAFACPTVNIGSRQQGRLRADNVIDTEYDSLEIQSAIEKCLYDEAFIKIVKECENPYGMGDSGKRIADILSELKIDNNLIQKKMTY